MLSKARVKATKARAAKETKAKERTMVLRRIQRIFVTDLPGKVNATRVKAARTVTTPKPSPYTESSKVYRP